MHMSIILMSNIDLPCLGLGFGFGFGIGIGFRIGILTPSTGATFYF